MTCATVQLRLKSGLLRTNQIREFWYSCDYQDYCLISGLIVPGYLTNPPNCQTGWLNEWFADKPIDWSREGLIERPTERLTNRPTSGSTDQSRDDRLTDGNNDQRPNKPSEKKTSTDQSTECLLTNRLNDQGRLTNGNRPTDPRHIGLTDPHNEWSNWLADRPLIYLPTE